jgi:hypothetical protein
MLTARFHLRSLMILVALAAVGWWIAITSWRIWYVLSMLESKSAGILSLAYAVLFLGGGTYRGRRKAMKLTLSRVVTAPPTVCTLLRFKTSMTGSHPSRA